MDIIANDIFSANILTGGSAGSLDDIDHNNIGDGDIAIVISAVDSKFYLYDYDASSAAAESSPDIINPDSHAGENGRWLLNEGIMSDLEITSGVLQLPNGTSIDELSIDGTLAGDSDDAVPTEKAVKTYVDTEAAFPAGMVTAFAHATAPSGWLECDGSSVLRASYADLFTAIGVIYGNVDGTHFNVPDYRGQFFRGWDHGAGVDPGAASRTDRGDGTLGDNVGTKQVGDVIDHAHDVTTTGAHTHTVSLPNSLNVSGEGWANMDTGSVAKTTSSDGDHTHVVDGGHITDNETRPINVNVMYCIKT